MIEYKYEEKEVEVFGKKYKAIFPKNHSRVKGLVYRWWDANSGDLHWANVSRWNLDFFVLWKGSKNWENINNDEYNSSSHAGFFYILHRLETDEVREKINRKIRIEELKKNIKRDQKELEKLEKYK
jgi:hypothetical protein